MAPRQGHVLLSSDCIQRSTFPSCLTRPLSQEVSYLRFCDPTGLCFSSWLCILSSVCPISSVLDIGVHIGPFCLFSLHNALCSCGLHTPTQVLMTPRSGLQLKYLFFFFFNFSVRSPPPLPWLQKPGHLVHPLPFPSVPTPKLVIKSFIQLSANLSDAACSRNSGYQ